MIALGILWAVVFVVLFVLEYWSVRPNDEIWELNRVIKDKDAIINETAKELNRLREKIATLELW